MALPFMMFIIVKILIILSYVDSVNCSPRAPALYVFGDSLVDSGNNNAVLTIARADYFPYGVNFENGVSTGRFTNGRTVADFIAEYLGLPYPPPYNTNGASNQGSNFASSSCGILPSTGLFAACFTLDDQIRMFTKVVQEDLPNYLIEPKNVTKHLSKSVFLVLIGSNDYLVNYLVPWLLDPTKSLHPPQFAHYLIGQLSQRLHKLYKLGARKIVIFELGPLGCTPYIKATRGFEQDCDEDVNKQILMFNDLLAPLLRNLTSTLRGSAFILGRVNELALDAAVNPLKYGIQDSKNPCCSTAFHVTACCLGLPPCDYPNGNYFFDSFHPTETVYKIIAERCFSGSACVPKNIKALL